MFERSFSWFSIVTSYRTVTFQAPTIVSHHSFIPATLIPSFHFRYILVESLALLFTKCSKIRRKVAEVRVQKMYLNTHSAAQSLIDFNHVSYDILGFLRLVVPRKFETTASNPSQACFLREFIFDLKSWSDNNSRIWGPTNMPEFNLASQYMGISWPNIWKHYLLYSMLSHSFSLDPI